MLGHHLGHVLTEIAVEQGVRLLMESRNGRSNPPSAARWPQRRVEEMTISSVPERGLGGLEIMPERAPERCDGQLAAGLFSNASFMASTPFRPGGIRPGIGMRMVRSDTCAKAGCGNADSSVATRPPRDKRFRSDDFLLQGFY